ncbi:MAG TPA: MFS transporter [Candidatus Methylomirabilis sp.]
MADPFPVVPPGGAETAVPHPGSLLTPTFVLTWCATFTFFLSYYLLLPTVPLYAVGLGGTEAQVGLVMGLLTAASTVTRPCVAPAIDRRRRKPFIAAGAAIVVVCGLLYNGATSIPRLLLLRIFHGVGMGTFMTAATTLVADGAPLPRRGEAMGAYGLAINLAMALAPAAGMALVNSTSFAVLFASSAGVALVALALATAVPEAPRAPACAGEPAPGTGAGALGGVLSRPALFPSAIVLALTTTYGAVLTFLPIWGRANQLENPGTFFTLYAVSLLAVRTRAGKLSDRFGRGAVIVPGLGIMAVALVLLAAAGRPWQVLAAGVVYGAGMGAVQPSLAALLTDRAPEAERARAFATYYGAFELGIAVGAIGLGAFLEATSFPAMWTAAAAVAAVGAVTFLAGARGGAGRAPSQPLAEC